MKKNLLTGITILIVIFMYPTDKTSAQAPIQNGTSNYNYDLYHIKDVGIGADDDPKARVHIFNGYNSETLPNSNQVTIKKTNRPFLITGRYATIDHILVNGNPVYNYAADRSFFTVNKKGYVGIDVLDPFTKMHLHSGVFTFTSGNIEEPSAYWQIHGTSNAFAIKDQLANRHRFWINKSNGFVGIGTTSPSEMLQVAGNVIVDGNQTVNGTLEVNNGGTTNFKVYTDGEVRAREVKVDLQTIPDYVFKEDYNLMPLKELKKFVETNKHLPNIKSEAEFQEEGSYSLGEMNLKLLEKVEELTLYILQLEERLSKVELGGGVK